MKAASLKKLAISAALLGQLLSIPCMSAIPRHNIYGIDATKIVEPVESTQTIKSEDVARWIPTNMEPSSRSGEVASRILDFGVQNMLKSPEFRSSALVRSAAKVDSVMASDMSFGGDEGSTKHIFKFRMKPTQTMAQLAYNGYLNANVNYQIARETLNVEVFEKVSAGTDLVLSHVDTRDDRRDMVSMRWSF